MNQDNPQINATLDELAELVCQSLQNTGSELPTRREGLLRTLVMSGYMSHSDRNLPMDIESRVKSRCGEQASHRGGAISSITSQLSEELQSLAKWEANTPDKDSPSKAANFSSATES